jgi:hypothetical protein
MEYLATPDEDYGFSGDTLGGWDFSLNPYIINIYSRMNIRQ